MKVKKFVLLCDNGEYSTTQHTDIEVVKNLYLNQNFRDLDMKLKKCIQVIETDDEVDVFFLNIIKKLKQLNKVERYIWDILEELDMTEKMLKYLILNNPESDTYKYLKEKQNTIHTDHY